MSPSFTPLSPSLHPDAATVSEHHLGWLRSVLSLLAHAYLPMHLSMAATTALNTMPLADVVAWVQQAVIHPEGWIQDVFLRAQLLPQLLPPWAFVLAGSAIAVGVVWLLAVTAMATLTHMPYFWVTVTVYSTPQDRALSRVVEAYADWREEVWALTTPEHESYAIENDSTTLKNTTDCVPMLTRHLFSNAYYLSGQTLLYDSVLRMPFLYSSNIQPKPPSASASSPAPSSAPALDLGIFVKDIGNGNGGRGAAAAKSQYLNNDENQRNSELPTANMARVITVRYPRILLRLWAYCNKRSYTSNFTACATDVLHRGLTRKIEAMRIAQNAWNTKIEDESSRAQGSSQINFWVMVNATTMKGLQNGVFESMFPIYNGPCIGDREQKRAYFLKHYFHHRRDDIWARVERVLDMRDKFRRLADYPFANKLAALHWTSFAYKWHEEENASVAAVKEMNQTSENERRALAAAIQEDMVNAELCMLLHGPPGNGKTRLAGILAIILNDSVRSMDILGAKHNVFLEYMSRNSISSMRNPGNAILLFDEFDRALKVMDQYSKSSVLERWDINTTAAAAAAKRRAEEQSTGATGTGSVDRVPAPPAIDFESAAASFPVGVDTFLQVFGSGLGKGSITLATANDLAYFTDNENMHALIRPGRFEPFHVPAPDIEVATQIALARLPLERADEAPALGRRILEAHDCENERETPPAHRTVVGLLRVAGKIMQP